MADNLIIAGQSTRRKQAARPLSGVTTPATSEVSLFQFGLRQCFWLIALVSVLLAGLVSAHGVTSLVLLLAALVAAAHVFATALGSRLREDADKSTVWQADRAPPGDGGSLRLRDARLPISVRRSPWHGRGSTALPWLPGLVLTGILIGGIVGAVLLTLTIGQRTSLAGIAVGSVSLAVLGGWFTFLGGSFYGIFRHGLRDALADQKSDEPQRPPR